MKDEPPHQPTVLVMPPTSALPSVPPRERREERRAIRVEAIVTTPTGYRFSFQTVSLSLRGFFLSASTRQVPLTIGTVCGVELRSKEHRVRLRAELVHIGHGQDGRREGYGFQITMLTREQQMHLERLIEDAPSFTDDGATGTGLFARSSGKAAFLAAGVAAASALVAIVAWIAQSSRTVVDVSSTRQSDIEEVLSSGAGEIAARRIATVRSMVTTPASFTLHVEQGAVVRSGDVVATLIDRTLDPSKSALEAKLISAESRVRELTTKNADSAAVTEAALTVTRLRAEITAKGIDVQRRHVVAPFDAVVVELFARSGESVPASGPVAELMDTSQLRAKVPFREGEAARISAGMHATVRLPGAASVDGVVDGLGLVARPYGDVRKAVLVEVTLPADFRVRPGTTARAEVQLPTRSTLMVPSSAIWQENERNYVWVLPGRSGDLDVKMVETGAVMGGSTEIVHGLSPGSIVLTHGDLPGLKRGLHVTAR
jgi:RND family efflux transporter MFP subunit